MGKSSRRRFRCFSCFKTPSSPGAQDQIPLPTHTSTSAEVPPILNKHQDYGSPSSTVVATENTIISSLQLEPSSSSTPSAAIASSSQAKPSPNVDDKGLEGVSSETSNTTTDNLQSVPSSSTVLSAFVATASSSEPNPSPHDEVDLDALIQHIHELLKEKESHKTPKSKTLQEKPKQTTHSFWPTTSEGLSKLREILSTGIEEVNKLSSSKDVNDLSSETKTVIKDILKRIGQLHWATAVLLVVSTGLERFEAISENRDDCLFILKEMYLLAKYIKNLKNRPQLNNCMEDTINEGTDLLVEALMCTTQIDRSKVRMFFSTSSDRSKLDKFKNGIATVNRHFQDQINFATNDLAFANKKDLSVIKAAVMPPRTPRERPYPDNAEGIEEQLKKVNDFLEWESEKKALAVILWGIGGMGKTTLADAVFAQHTIKGCKYAMVKLSEDDTSTPNIVKLQNSILNDLRIGTEDEALPTFEGSASDGQRAISGILRKVEALIYIDNVVTAESLRDLLPRRDTFKKLRVLITTRNKNVRVALKMENRDYPVGLLPPAEGLKLLKKEIYRPAEGLNVLKKEIYNVAGDSNRKLSDSQLDDLVKICGGIPLLLILTGSYIYSEKDKEKAYRIVKEDTKHWNGDSLEGLDKKMFSYDTLPEECKDAFLDICSFFKGWECETVANIVGESALDMLEKRALVSRDKNVTVSVHDVVLSIGKLKAKNTRFDLTEASTSDIEEFFKKDIKAITGLKFSDQKIQKSCKIPFEPMSGSLRIFAHKMEWEEGQCGNAFEKLLCYNGETPHFPFNWSQLKALRFLNYQPQNLDLLQKISRKTLKHIELDGRLCSVSEISASDIQEFQQLQVLRLINFEKLENLPEDWGPHLSENLKELTLSHSTSMKELTGSISKLKNLKILKLDNCWNLERLSKGCESLRSLQELNLWNCLSLEALPSSLGEALDSDSRRLFKHKGVLLDPPQ